ncbi:hypothetical protein ABMA28_013934 [Loxostege sticticalis]|uniref:Reverse transcriptase domain-containing protein n=1 Tax=Loxostege sticticalis TaxID=481309 RepID=A0ABD0TF11_LOXSC
MIKWFREYLSSRQLKVRVCGAESKIGDIRFGVPTGSVYGPVGYIMHVNSMPNVIKKCATYMYADDTCLVYSDTDQNQIQNIMQEDFDNVVRWAHDNGIIINTNKTKCMPILSPYNKNKEITIELKGHSYDCLHKNKNGCTCSKLETVHCYKYLGLTVESHFSWNIHINSVCNKLRSVLGKLQQLRYTTTRGVMYVLYYALADAVMSYGLGAYGLTFSTYLNKVNSLQIRFLKLLVDDKVKKSLKKDYNKLFKICEILPIEMKIKQMILIEQYNSNEHIKVREHTYATRLSKKPKFVVPKVTNYYGRRERRWLTPVYLNELPHEFTKNALSKNHLKNMLKKHYLSLCP